MPGWLQWMTSMEYSKPIALLLFFFTFIAIVVYVFTGKKRKERFESYKYIPFEDEKDDSKDDDEKG